MATDPQLSDAGTLAIKPPRTNIFVRAPTAAIPEVAASPRVDASGVDSDARAALATRGRGPLLRIGVVVAAITAIAMAVHDAAGPGRATRGIERFPIADPVPRVMSPSSSADGRQDREWRRDRPPVTRRRAVTRHPGTRPAPRARGGISRDDARPAAPVLVTPRPAVPAPPVPARPVPPAAEPKRPVPARVPDGAPPEFM